MQGMQGVNIMAKAIKNQTVDVQYAPTSFKAKNAPKLNSVAIACNELLAIAKQGQTVAGLTMFGHKQNCKGGVIDATIFSGKVHSIESFISTLLNSGLTVVNNDVAKFKPATVQAVLAKRIVDHVTWCSQVTNKQHGGFSDRLAKVGLSAQRDKLGALLIELSNDLQRQFKLQYAPLYAQRNKTGLLGK